MVKKDFIPTVHPHNLKALHLPDCIHLSERCGCELLRVCECVGESCAFRQNQVEQDLSQRQWLAALNALSYDEQERIANKYYNGKMPWKILRKKR